MNEKLTEKSLIPISLVITLLSLAFYLGQTSNDIRANTLEITELKDKREGILKQINEMNRLLITVEAHLRFIIKEKKQVN